MKPQNDLWQSSARIPILKRRAQALAQIRRFFEEREVMEVETPLLYPYGSCDPFLKSWRAYVNGENPTKAYYLQTSPEYAMKRLLASGSGSIYQMAKVFRGDEQGRYHNPEFTMLEWYRVGWTYAQLMDEVVALIQLFLTDYSVQRIAYHDVFLTYLSVDPWSASAKDLEAVATQHHITVPDSVDKSDKDMWLMWLLATLIEPQWANQGLVLVYDYPPTQAILAELGERDYGIVAKRFEVYLQGIELANGFQELQDAKLQRQRFVADNDKRRRFDLPLVTIDEHLLAALEAGLPACAGVALGIDKCYHALYVCVGRIWLLCH